jgi:prepilin-type N-terminal cleavage/methylation domain-containing protein
MKKQSTKHGFTLIEILIVITIIGILAAILLPAIMGAILQAQKAETRTACLSIQQAITIYQTTYNKMPVASGTATEMFDGAASVAIIKALIGEDPTINPRGESLLEGDIEDDGTFLDKWDTQYRIYLDTDGDGEVTVGGVNKKTRVVVHSAGRNALFYARDPTEIHVDNDDISTLK